MSLLVVTHSDGADPQILAITYSYLVLLPCLHVGRPGETWSTIEAHLCGCRAPDPSVTLQVEILSTVPRTEDGICCGLTIGGSVCIVLLGPDEGCVTGTSLPCNNQWRPSWTDLAGDCILYWQQRFKMALLLNVDSHPMYKPLILMPSPWDPDEYQQDGSPLVSNGQRP